MLTPDQLKAASTLLQPIFEEYEDFVIKEIVRRLKNAGEWTGSAEMQANLGVSTGVSVNEIILAIKKSLKISDQELAALFEELGATGLLQFNERLTGSGIDPIKIEKFPRLEQITKEAIYQTQGTLHNFTNSMGFSVKTVSGMRFMEMAAWYQNALDVAMLKVSTGVQDYNQAIRQIIKEMAQSGLRIVDYSTSYSCGIDVAVRRALLTGLNQMATEHALEVGNILETDLVEVTAHSGARPSHAVWQGKVYKLHGRTSQYPNLAEATGYGSVSGLKGANCRHSFFPYVEGMPRTYSDEQLMVIDPPPFSYKGKVYTRYEATQKQRAYERRIRALKRELVAYDAAGLEEEFKEASNLLYRTRRYYERFSEVANLRVKNERHQVYEFGRGISGKATQAARRKKKKLKALENKTKPVMMSLIITDKNDNYGTNGEKVKTEPGFYKVVIHGDKEGFGVVNPKTRKVLKRYTPQELCDIIKNDSDYNGGAIKLYSCYVAADDSKVAQEVANIMGVMVKAPVGPVWINSNGTYFVTIDNNENNRVPEKDAWKIIMPDKI